MKKKLLSLALVLAMALTLLPTAAFATNDGDACPNVDKSSCTGGTVKKTAQVDAACGKTGLKAYWTCSGEGACGKKFADNNGTIGDEISDFDAWSGTGGDGVIAALEHDAKPTSGANTWTTNETQHSYTCSKCNTELKENHNFGTGDTCTVCGYKKSSTTPTEKSITVSSAAFSNENKTLTVSWTSANLTEGSKFSVAIGGSGAPTLENNTDLTGTSFTQTFGTAVAAGTYTVTVTADGVSGTKQVTVGSDSGSNITVPPTPTTPETPAEDPNKAPSNDSNGIPMASEVSSPQQAQAAINTLKNTDAAALSNRLLSNESAAASFQALDYAVQNAKGVRVTVDVDRSSAPSAVRSGVSVTGAAFNASTTNSTVSLVVDAPSQAYSVTSGYQISMTMTGVPSAAKLDVPVLITLPLPSDVRSDRVVVLHYHNGSSTPTTIVPAVSGSSIRFTVTGFSDFVVTDKDASVARPGNNTGYVSGNAGKVNTGNTLDSATLAAIAGMLSGNGVFVDVPENHWAAKEIRWARDGGLMSGYGNGYFSPNASTTRQQLWMVLARLSGTRPADMAVARQWAINTGVSDGSDPTGILSRQQLVTMLYRFAKSQGVNVSASAKLGGYADGAKVASYAKDAMNWAVGKGIVTGSGSKLNPEGTATRAHFAVFLYRYSHI